jgi:hypothetical protein
VLCGLIAYAVCLAGFFVRGFKGGGLCCLGCCSVFFNTLIVSMMIT